MRNYPHILSELFYKPIVLTKAKHTAIWRILEARLAGNAGPGPSAIAEEGAQWELASPDCIIPVHGVMGKHLSAMEMESGGCSLDGVSMMLDAAVADPRVKRIILDFQSPGGAVTGTPELARKIASITSKETIAFTDSECCSGALWLATQCQQFYATESSSVGSIGVWCAYLDLSKQMANEGENMQEISAGKFKTMGAYWRPLTQEERSMLQKDVDKIYGQFKEAVNTRRTVEPEYMEGQILDGSTAVAAGMVDGLVESLDEIL